MLGAPATLTDLLSVTVYPIREGERGDSDWAQRARRSWPLNVIWRQDPPLEESWFDVVVHIPETLFLEIASAAAAGRIKRAELDMRLERAFVIDRERPDGAEDEPAFLAPFDERGRQRGPNLGYVSALTIQEHATGMKKSGDGQDLEPHPSAASTLNPPALGPRLEPPEIGAAIGKVSGRLGVLIVLIAALVVVMILKH